MFESRQVHNESNRIGCGREAKRQFKNGKFCCSESTNQCLTIIEKNKEKHPRGINPWKDRKHPMLGRKNPHKGICKYNWKSIQEFYNEGNTVRECYKHFGISEGAVNRACVRGDFKTRNLVDAMKLSAAKGRVPITTPEGWDKGKRKRLSEAAKIRNLGGKRNSHRFVYNGIVLDSSYELRLAKLLDKQKIDWIRPKPLVWIDEEQERHLYYPDFYLPEYDTYLDPKNDYLIKEDTYKIEKVNEYNNLSIKIISLSQIEDWEKTAIPLNYFYRIY